VNGGDNMEDYQKEIKHIQEQAIKLLKILMKDRSEFDPDALKQTVEQLTRVIVDITTIQIDKNVDVRTTLQATRAKIKIAYNLLEGNKRCSNINSVLSSKF
jgi:hypothetical protein